MAFYGKASPEETSTFEQLLDSNQIDNAWEYLKKVTDTELEPF